MSDREGGNAERAGMSRLRLVVRVVVSLIAICALMFLPAGKLDWLNAWLFLLFFFGFILILYTWMRRHDPALVAERQRSGPNAERWDRVIMGIYSVLLLGLPIVAGLDERLGWSSLPLAVQLVGWMGLVAALVIVWWSMASNPYLSEVVRIQEERGHRVVGDGPYRYVRHPMYIGVIVSFLSVPLVLGSYWALVPGGLCMLLFIVRTALEDRTLREKLPGYAEYASRVRYRLIPGVW
ncbi:MAG: isoprenylcysteine carboxylmethyltransferase family protein [Anaerolineae bacterium]|nr:isoprenylcysteine carboxylmethyltransferase family protein [Anaerolineae bacterium]